MGQCREGFVRSRGCPRTQTRIRVSSTSEKNNEKYEKQKDIKFSKEKDPPRRGRVPFRKRGGGTSQGPPQGVLLEPIFSTKERWWLEAGDKPKRPQSLHKEEAIQDGNTEGRLPEPEAGRLGVDYRSEGRIFACPYCKGAQTVPAFLLGRDAVPVQKVTVRSQFSPPDFHEGNASFGNTMQNAGDQDNRLFGRFPGPRAKQGGTQVTHSFRVEHVEEGRVPEEPQEVQPGTKAGVPVPGFGLGHKESQSLSARRKEERFQGVGSPDIEESQHSLSAEVPRQSYLCMEGSSLGEAAYKTVPDVCNQGSEVRTSDSGRRSREGYQMVDSNSAGRSGIENASNIIVHDNRCLSLRLGRDTGPQISQWEVDSERSGTAHQSSGAVSSDEGGSSFCSQFEKQRCYSSLGQCHGRLLPVERGRNEVGSVKRANPRHFKLLQQAQSGPGTCLPTRHSKSRSRCAIQGDADKGMVPRSCGDEEDVPAPRYTGGRPFCLQQVSPGPEVLHSGQERQQGSGSQCSSASLAIQSDVRISSPSAYSPDFNQNEDVQGISNLGHTTLVQGNLAAGANPVVDTAASTTTSGTVDSTRPEHRQRPALPGEAQADSLVHLRESFQGQGADQTLAEFICGSWRGSTKTQYSYAWRTWSDWCAGGAVSRTEPSVGQFANFLWFLYRDRRMAWSSIRTHRAAVATIIDPLTQNPLSQHPMISRFMKAVYLARPPKGKVKPIWSVSEVLEELRSWGLAEALPRSRLTWRLTMLLALASARRASDLSLLHIDSNHLFRSTDSWRFHLAFGAKQDRPGHIPKDIVISKQQAAELCPLENLREYLRRTEEERQGSMQLLRTTVAPFRPAGRQTIRSWLSRVLELSNIQAPGGSTRAASATWAAAKAVPISTIMAAADWSSVKTMSRYYLRPLPQGAPASEHLSVQRAVLGDV